MKKMAIVPFKILEEMNRWKSEQRPKLPPNPQVTQTSDLQKEMGSVLQRQDISETEKAQLFGQTLQKFQLAHKKVLQPVVQPTPYVSTEKKPLQDRIINSVPVTMRRKAKLLIQMLEDHPNMSWNDQGVLEVKGKPISGSNMIDLVNDVLRHRKHVNPRGWEQFSHGLSEINVPQEYVGNKQRWSWMQKQGESDDDEFFDTSNIEPSPRTKKDSIKRQPVPSGSQMWESY